MLQDQANTVLNGPKWQQCQEWAGEYAAVPMDDADAVLGMVRYERDLDAESRPAAVRVRLTVEVLSDDE